MVSICGWRNGTRETRLTYLDPFLRGPPMMNGPKHDDPVEDSPTHPTCRRSNPKLYIVRVLCWQHKKSAFGWLFKTITDTVWRRVQIVGRIEHASNEIAIQVCGSHCLLLKRNEIALDPNAIVYHRLASFNQPTNFNAKS